MSDLTAAIKTVKASRQTHVEWRDYWLKVDHATQNCKTCTDITRYAGDLEHQTRCIKEYDNVLAVLEEARKSG